MQQEEEGAISLEEIRDIHGKATTIIRSSLAIISLTASCILIRIIQRSNDRFSTTYHRLLLGMSVADILLSIGYAHFNFTAPSDNNYFVWNARGNQMTCSAQGFVFLLGFSSSPLYNCSINLYSLAVVRYQKTNDYIRKRIEPFLHGGPILYAIITSTILLANKNINDAGGGSCYAPVYEPPHCTGYEDGEIRDGFNIPCGRGRDGTVIPYYVLAFITFFLLPIIICVSIGMIYRTVRQQEKRMEHFGANAFADITARSSTAAVIDTDERRDHGTWLNRLRSSLSTLVNRQSTSQSSSTSNNRRVSNSRLVMRRAVSFTCAYVLTWSFPIIGMCLDVAKIEWPNAIWYLSSIFTPLQGFFNLCIFLQPKVSHAKSRGGDDVTWCQAVARAFSSE